MRRTKLLEFICTSLGAIISLSIMTSLVMWANSYLQLEPEAQGGLAIILTIPYLIFWMLTTELLEKLIIKKEH